MCMLMSQALLDPEETRRPLMKQLPQSASAMDAQGQDATVLSSQSGLQLRQSRPERGARAGQVAQVLWMHANGDGGSDLTLHVGRQLHEWRAQRCCAHDRDRVRRRPLPRLEELADRTVEHVCMCTHDGRRNSYSSICVLTSRLPPPRSSVHTIRQLYALRIAGANGLCFRVPSDLSDAPRAS